MPFFENSIGLDYVICLHVDTRMSIEMFVFTQILDIQTNLKYDQVLLQTEIPSLRNKFSKKVKFLKTLGKISCFRQVIIPLFMKMDTTYVIFVFKHSGLGAIIGI